MTFLYISEKTISFVKKIVRVPDFNNLDQSVIPTILSDQERMSKIMEMNKRYLHWDEVRYRVEENEAISVWAIMKILRNNGLKTIHVCGLDLKCSLLPDFQEWLHHIDRDSVGYFNKVYYT